MVMEKGTTILEWGTTNLPHDNAMNLTSGSNHKRETYQCTIQATIKLKHESNCKDKGSATAGMINRVSDKSFCNREASK